MVEKMFPMFSYREGDDDSMAVNVLGKRSIKYKGKKGDSDGFRVIASEFIKNPSRNDEISNRFLIEDDDETALRSLTTSIMRRPNNLRILSDKGFEIDREMDADQNRQILYKMRLRVRDLTANRNRTLNRLIELKTILKNIRKTLGKRKTELTIAEIDMFKNREKYHQEYELNIRRFQELSKELRRIDEQDVQAFGVITNYEDEISRNIKYGLNSDLQRLESIKTADEVDETKLKPPQLFAEKYVRAEKFYKNLFGKESDPLSTKTELEEEEEEESN